MHELFSIVAVPIVAQKLGYIEAVALPVPQLWIPCYRW